MDEKEKKFNKAVGKHLTEARELYCEEHPEAKNQTVFAKMIGIEKSTDDSTQTRMSRLENGLVPATPRELLQYQKHCKIPISYFLTGKGSASFLRLHGKISDKEVMKILFMLQEATNMEVGFNESGEFWLKGRASFKDTDIYDIQKVEHEYISEEEYINAGQRVDLYLFFREWSNFLKYANSIGKKTSYEADQAYKGWKNKQINDIASIQVESIIRFYHREMRAYLEGLISEEPPKFSFDYLYDEYINSKKRESE